MKSLIIGISVAGAILAGAALATPAYSKGKKLSAKEKLAAERAKLVKTYETKKKGKLFFNAPKVAYWLDIAKMEESRWSIETRKAGNTVQTVEMFAKLAGPKADQPPYLDIQVWATRHYEMKGGKRMIQNFSFDDANMSGIKPSKLDDWIKAKYLSWVNTSKDPIKKECSGEKAKKASGFGPAKKWAYATATDKDSGARVRKEWYGWVDKELTFDVQVTYSTAVYQKDAYRDKVKDFMKNIKKAK